MQTSVCAGHGTLVARNVMRAGLWPIFAGARRAENPAAVSFCQHRRLAVAGETEVRAQAPVVGHERAPEPDQCGAEKAISGGKVNERRRVAQGRDVRRDDVAEDEDTVCAQQPVEQGEQIVELLRGEVLRDRMQHHDIERSGRQGRDLLRRAHLDRRIPAEAACQRGAHHGRGLAQDQRPGGRARRGRRAAPRRSHNRARRRQPEGARGCPAQSCGNARRDGAH